MTLKKRKPEEIPYVLIGIFIERVTPFLMEFFDDIAALKYPKSKLGLYIHNAIDYHEDLVNKFIATARESKYAHVIKLPNTGYMEPKARELGM